MSRVAAQTPVQGDLVCLTTQYIDIAGLECSECDPNQNYEVSSDGFDCLCKPGFILVAVEGTMQCLPCQEDESSSFDRMSCLPCSNATTTGLSSTKECLCEPGHTLVDRDITGTLLPEISCVPCAGVTSTEDPTVCIPCSDDKMVFVDGLCTCPDGYETYSGSCLPSDVYATLPQGSVTASTRITYHSVIQETGVHTSETLDSVTLQSRFPKAAVKCLDELDREACQMLGNLCLLNDYDEDYSACVVFDQIYNARRLTNYHGREGWAESLPWLFYQEVSSAVYNTEIGMKVTFAGKGAEESSIFNYKWAVYTLDGEYRGFEDIGVQMQFCENPRLDDRELFAHFGTSFRTSCSVDVLSLLDRETLFYDPYFEDADGDLVPLPVLPYNLRRNSREVNLPENALDYFDNQYTRRMVLVDNLSGKTTHNNADDPQVIRFASQIKMIMRMQDGQEEMIYPPIITIRYEEVNVELARQSDKIRYRPVTFEVEYASDQTGFWDSAFILFMFAMFAILILWGIRQLAWSRRNQNSQLDETTLVKLIINLSSSASDCLFVVMIILTFYWFLFFKIQGRVHSFLPGEKGESTFRSVLIAVFIGKTIHIIDLVRQQCKIEIFFMDWEKSRGRLVGKGNRSSEQAPISIWRTILVANEWNELMVERWIHLEFSLFCMIFFMSGLSLENLARAQPSTGDLDREMEPVPYNKILRFAISAFFWLIVVVAQFIWKYAIHHRYIEDKNAQFVDLLSLANLSCFIMTDRYAGYYIHGRSVHPHADCPLHEMNQNLKKEEDNLCPPRGMFNNDTQTFEMFLTKSLRDQYDRIYHSLLSASVAQRVTETGRLGRTGKGRQSQPDKVPEEKLVKQYHELNKYLTSFIDKIQTEQASAVQTKNMMQRVFNLPPDMGQMSDTVLFNDKDMSFREVFFHGIETHLCIWNILIYSLFDMMFTNSFLAVVFVYLGQKILEKWRLEQGEENLSRKTLVDRRFLI